MNCDGFQRWLDDGMPEGDAVAALAHARACSDCTAALEAARALERLLSAPAPAASAPAGFGERVMARVADVEARGAQAPPQPSPLPWWVRAAAQPAAALAFVVAGLMLLYGQAVVAAASRLTIAAANALATAPAPGAPTASPLTHPDILAGLAVALLPLGVWVSWRLFTWSEHAVMARTPRPERFLV